MQTKFDIGQTVWTVGSKLEDYPVYSVEITRIEISDEGIGYQIENDLLFAGCSYEPESLLFATEAEAEEASMKLLKESIADVEEAIESKKARLKELAKS